MGRPGPAGLLRRARSRAPAPDRAVRRPCRRPASGRSGRARSRCRARRCRPRPGIRSPRQASARPSVARSSCQATFGLLGVAEVEAVGQAERLGADAGQVLGALEHRLDRAGVRIAGDPPPVAVDRHRDRPVGLGQHQHGRVRFLWPPHRPRADHRVVLLESPALRGDVGGGEEPTEDRRGITRVGRAPGAQRDQLAERLGVAVQPALRLLGLEVVEGTFVDQGGNRDVPDLDAVVEHPEPSGLRHLADRGRAGLPPLAGRDDLVELRRFHHRQHALLGLGDHHLEGLEVGLAQGNARHVDVDPNAALGRHLPGRGGQSRGAEVLKGHQQVALEQLETALEQLRLLERVADLDAGPLRVVTCLQLGRGQHRGAADPVAPGRGAHHHHQVARARGSRADHLVGAGEADAHGVD